MLVNYVKINWTNVSIYNFLFVIVLNNDDSGKASSITKENVDDAIIHQEEKIYNLHLFAQTLISN